VFQLLGTGNGKGRVLKGASDAAELTISEDAGDPGSVELPVIAEANGAEPTGAALPLVNAEGNASCRVLNALIGRPQPAAAAAEDVKTSPVIDRRGRRRRGLHGEVRRRCPTTKSAKHRERRNKPFHRNLPEGLVSSCGTSYRHPGELLYLASHSRTHSVDRTRQSERQMLADKKILADLFRDNPDAASVYLTEKLEKNDFDATRTALGLIVQAQNVQILARDAGLRRDTLYKTFGGKRDPHLSRVLKVFGALNLHFQVVPSAKCDFPPPQQHLTPLPHNERAHAQLLRDDNEAVA